MLGITPEVARKVKKDVLKAVINKQRVSLQACFHPDSSIAPDREKYQEVVEAYKEINPDNLDSNFDIWYQRLKNPSKRRKDAASKEQEVSSDVKWRLNHVLKSLQAVMQATVLRTTGKKKDESIDSKRGLITSVNAIEKPHEFYLMIRKPHRKGEKPAFFGVMVNDGKCSFFNEEKIESPEGVEMQEGQQVIRKGNSFFLITPISISKEYKAIGSTDYGIGHYLQRLGDKNALGISGKKRSEGAGYTREAFDIALQEGMIYTPEIKTDSVLIAVSGSGKNTRFHSLGGISRIDMPDNYRIAQIEVDSGAKQSGEKWRLDSSGIVCLKFQGQKEIAYTLEAFSQENNFDTRDLIITIKTLSVSPLPLECVGESGGDTYDTHIFLYKHLLKVGQQTFGLDGLVHYSHTEPHRAAINLEGFIEMCKYRNPSIHAAQLYPLVQKYGVKSIARAYAHGEFARGQEVFDVEDLERLYDQYVDSL